MRINKVILPALALVTAGALGGTFPAFAQQDATQPRDSVEREGDLYLLDTCSVSGRKLGSMGDPVVKTIDGREVRFCCAGCVSPFEEKTEEQFRKIDEKMVEQQLPYYPLDTCVVSGETLSEDTAVDHVHLNRLVRFCCDMCIDEFSKDPEKFLSSLDEAVVAQQREKYPLKTCAVLEDSRLGSMGEPAEMIVGNRLVKFCCAGCEPGFERNPAPSIKRLDAAWKEQGMPGAASASEAPGDHDHPHDHPHDHDHDHGHGG